MRNCCDASRAIRGKTDFRHFRGNKTATGCRDSGTSPATMRPLRRAFSSGGGDRSVRAPETATGTRRPSRARFDRLEIPEKKKIEKRNANEHEPRKRRSRRVSFCNRNREISHVRGARDRVKTSSLGAATRVQRERGRRFPRVLRARSRPACRLSYGVRVGFGFYF